MMIFYGRDRWQPTDYAEFRVNYATHMHNPSIELEEQEREETMGPAPVVPTTANADTPASTATVEGVLVVAASPAPAPLAARPVNPLDGAAGASGRRHGNGGGGGNHKVGIGAGGGGAAVPSQERVSKSFRQERVRKQRVREATLLAWVSFGAVAAAAEACDRRVREKSCTATPGVLIVLFLFNLRLKRLRHSPPVFVPFCIPLTVHLLFSSDMLAVYCRH